MVTTSGVLLLDTLGSCSYTSTEQSELVTLYQGFQSPPPQAKLFVRWWWNGNRLDASELERELDVMHEAGIGGVEINPIAFPRNADPSGYESMTMFDPDWLKMLEVALRAAKERGIICDMIVGSGWPFGGEFLEKDHQTQMVTIGTRDLRGGRHELSVQELLDEIDPELHSKHDRVYKDLVMLRLMPAASDTFVEGEDLMGKVNGDRLSLELPAGEYVLYYVVKLTGYMAVINGAPGAAGPVLNHYSREATEAYLERISNLITGQVGDMGEYIRAMFCDSMELEGANWVDDLPDEFEKRRGYSLWPYLPFVLKKVGHMGNPVEEDYGTKFSEAVSEQIKRVGIDYYQTRLELFKERFIDTFNDWCHRNHVQSRMQAYGRGMHPLEASMAVDIPESETWLFKEVGRSYPNTGLAGRAPRMCNKYVSSGAVLADKPIVSCEEITNTAMAFMATLENIKVAGDQSNLSGVNHSILHGFNYSPRDTPFPGWIRYGAYFNERNTWWPYFRYWAQYKARLSYLFQSATPLANLAILQPLTDLWLKHGPQRDPFPQRWYPDYQNNLWEVVHQNGGGCDYVSENVINQSRFDDGQMIFNNRQYDTLLLPELETLKPATARSLLDFARAGGKVVFIGKEPFKSASFESGESDDARVKQIVGQLLAMENVNRHPSPDGDLIAWYMSMQNELEIQGFVSFDQPQKFLQQSCYDLGGKRLYFIANSSLADHISVTAKFAVGDSEYPWLWDPETGERLRYPTAGANNELQLEIPRASALVIVFESEEEGPVYEVPPYHLPGAQISGPWRLQLQHIDGNNSELQLDKLVNLTELEAARSFAGEVLYEKTFAMDGEGFRYLDLGDVQGVSEVTLNGKPIGTRWYGAQFYDINDAWKPGDNTLRIRLTTIVGNYLKSLEDNPVAQGWTRHQDHYPMGVLGPVRLI